MTGAVVVILLVGLVRLVTRERRAGPVIGSTLPETREPTVAVWRRRPELHLLEGGKR